ncbi:hypothetical protein EVAR_85944_1 [Eumeta japonica]|uniref:Uncharacterized protein n=1 Tax=Eumeta variegata TaxID=151549 RepID=A0A4C2A597_EUMVA|nr:hypothetical protein EVAR_85944_1 [Eumeta japonica]
MKLHDLEHKIETKLENKMHEIMENPEKIGNSCHSQRKLPEATSRHRSMNRKRNEKHLQLRRLQLNTKNPKRIPKTEAQHCHDDNGRMLRCAETAESLGYEQEWLFMDENTERLE